MGHQRRVRIGFLGGVVAGGVVVVVVFVSVSVQVLEAVVLVLVIGVKVIVVVSKGIRVVADARNRHFHLENSKENAYQKMRKTSFV